MSTTVCLATIGYPEGGGHMWVYLNWALGLQAQGCNVIWLEPVDGRDVFNIQQRLSGLKQHLAPFGLDRSIALVSRHGLPSEIEGQCIDLDETVEAELLVNFWYQMPPDLVQRFRRTALIDIDPGLLQGWMDRQENLVPPHDLYVTTGEKVGRSQAGSSAGGRLWHFIPPCVSLDHWPVRPAEEDAPYTTVSHWQMGEWEYDGDEVYSNDKRTGFLPFIDLPLLADASLELARLKSLHEPEGQPSSRWVCQGTITADNTGVSVIGDLGKHPLAHCFTPSVL